MHVGPGHATQAELSAAAALRRDALERFSCTVAGSGALAAGSGHCPWHQPRRAGSAEVLAAVALGDPHEQEERAFGVGRGEALGEEVVEPLPWKPEYACEVRPGAAFAQEREGEADEAVPERGIATRTEGAVVAGDIGFAAADGFPGRGTGGIPERFDEAE